MGSSRNSQKSDFLYASRAHWKYSVLLRDDRRFVVVARACTMRTATTSVNGMKYECWRRSRGSESRHRTRVAHLATRVCSTILLARRLCSSTRGHLSRASVRTRMCHKNAPASEWKQIGRESIAPMTARAITHRHITLCVHGRGFRSRAYAK